MNRLFLTGMARSGTTLLDKLLGNHPDMQILSQPFPYLFVDAIKKFLRDNGIEKYYVMNDEIKSGLYAPEAFEAFLGDYIISAEAFAERFEAMQNYSGQYTRPDSVLLPAEEELASFHRIYSTALSVFDIDTKRSYIGSKETLCEAFIPYFCKEGIKTILIIRDPRDVLASMNYASGAKFAGSKKPTLFILRTWRKSFEYLYRLRKEENFLFLRYEDLVFHTDATLKRVTEFLQLAPFKINQFNQNITAQDGKRWEANSSFFGQKNGISTDSMGIHRTALAQEEIDYTNVICRKEMLWLGYNPGNVSEPERVIKTFRDYDVMASHEIDAGYSSRDEHIEAEIAWLHRRF